MTREKAIEMCKSIKDYLTAGNPVWSKEEVTDAMTMAIEALKDRQKGHWEYEDDSINFVNLWQCSECYEVVDEKTNFCPYCGADMRGENDE